MASLFRRSRAICPQQRSFSTSTPQAVSLQWDKNDPEALADVLPAYPHGPARWYKQSRLGLYGGQRVQFGNNVGEKFENKTRRTWHPNVLTQRLYSKALKRHVQVRVTARVLRTIDKLGGLDEYLLGEKAARIKSLGESGWWLRWAIMQTHAVKQRFAEERKRLGLPEEVSQEEEEGTPIIAEIAEGDEEMETVPMDDAFQVEQSNDLPPIKFRTDRRTHVELTPNGWIRTRPKGERGNHHEKLVVDIMKTRFPGYVERRLEEYQTYLRQNEDEENLSSDEMTLKIARQEFRRELREKAEEVAQAEHEKAGQWAKAQRQWAAKQRANARRRPETAVEST